MFDSLIQMHSDYTLCCMYDGTTYTIARPIWLYVWMDLSTLRLFELRVSSIRHYDIHAHCRELGKSRKDFISTKLFHYIPFIYSIGFWFSVFCFLSVLHTRTRTKQKKKVKILFDWFHGWAYEDGDDNIGDQISDDCLKVELFVVAWMLFTVHIVSAAIRKTIKSANIHIYRQFVRLSVRSTDRHTTDKIKKSCRGRICENIKCNPFDCIVVAEQVTLSFPFYFDI